MNPQLLYEQAASLHQKGNLAEAERLYLRILAGDPASLKARHFLGVIRFQQGRSGEALDLLGGVISERPDALPSLNMQGLIFQSLRRFDEALTSFGKAVALKPDFAEGWNSRGINLWELARFDEALTSYDRALAIKPDYVEALNNRGNCLGRLGRIEEALAGFDRALSRAPGNHVLHYNRADMLGRLNRLEEALAEYDAALRADPQNAQGWSNRGVVLEALQRPNEAHASYAKALAVDPENFIALKNRGYLNWDKYKNYDDAAHDLEAAMAIDPEHDYLRGDLLHLRTQGADWRDLDRQRSLIDDGVRAGRRVIKPLAYQALSDSPADLKSCAEIYAADRFPVQQALWRGSDRRHDRIRLGYVAGDYHRHAIAYLTAGLFELHDREQFDVIAYDCGRDDNSAIRHRLQAGFDRFTVIAGISDDDAARKIQADEIDILINISGYSGAERMGIFARRPAPLQVNYLGFPGTLGASYMDYILADGFVISETEKQFFSEKVVTLPHSYQVNDSRRAIAATLPNRADHGLPPEGFVFCNFNQSYKLLPESFALYLRLLKAVPGSVLWLLESNARCAGNFRREAELRGVDGNRLIFAPLIGLEDHLARIQLADLFVDSLPYNAHTTASDALWAGVPLVTCRGNAFAGRVAAGILNAAGMPELVTESPAELEALALALAQDPQRLQAVRQKIARNRLTTPLFDTAQYCRQLEAAYRKMWQIAEDGQAPCSFNI